MNDIATTSVLELELLEVLMEMEELSDGRMLLSRLCEMPKPIRAALAKRLMDDV
jgi:hypothetical protein